MCTSKVYCGERAWKVIRCRLRGPYSLSGFGHVWKNRDRQQRTDIGKHSFVHRTTRNWKTLLADV